VNLLLLPLIYFR